MGQTHTLAFQRIVAAPPSAVWRCWTEPDLLKQWFAPKPVTTTDAEIEPSPGGIFRTVMQVPEYGEMAGDPGCILVAIPNQRLVWTNALGPGFHPNLIGADPTDFAFTADIRIGEHDDGSIYDVAVHHATAEGMKAHEGMGFFDGWGTAATQMEAVARTL